MSTPRLERTNHGYFRNDHRNRSTGQAARDAAAQIPGGEGMLTAAPSATGLTDKATLVSRGWTVTTN